VTNRTREAEKISSGGSALAAGVATRLARAEPSASVRSVHDYLIRSPSGFHPG